MEIVISEDVEKMDSNYNEDDIVLINSTIAEVDTIIQQDGNIKNISIEFE